MPKNIRGWTNADARQAEAEGWQLVRIDFESILIEPTPETQRFQECPAAALAYVMLRANQGSSLHQRAYELEGKSTADNEAVTTALNYVLGDALEQLRDYCAANVPTFGSQGDKSHRVFEAAEQALAAMDVALSKGAA